MIIKEEQIRNIVKNTLSLVYLREIYSSFRKQLNENYYDEDADFNEVAALRKDLLNIAKAMYTKDEDDANDLVQDTIMRAYEKSPLYRDDTNLLGWLSRIMRNLFYGKINQQKDFVDVDDYNIAVAPKINAYSAEDDIVMNDDPVTIMNKIAREYADKHGEIYWTIYKLKRDGDSVAEIAEELGLSFDKVRRRWEKVQAHIRDNMKNPFKGKGDEFNDGDVISNDVYDEFDEFSNEYFEDNN